MNRFTWQDYIEERKDVLGGKPVFKGTRLTVEMVLDQLGMGVTNEQLLREFPTLKVEHIQAAMRFASAVITNDA